MSRHIPRGVHLSSHECLALASAFGRREVLDRLGERLPGLAHKDTRRAAEEAMVAIGLEARWFRDERPRIEDESAKVATTQMEPEWEWMTTTRASELMNVTPQRVRQLIGEGKVRAKRDTPNGPWRINSSDVRRWVASAKPGPQPATANTERMREQDGER